jgi:hypothetical protein
MTHRRHKTLFLGLKRLRKNSMGEDTDNVKKFFDCQSNKVNF